jgi:hypothetical protein
VIWKNLGYRDPAIHVSYPDWGPGSGYRKLKIRKKIKKIILKEPEFMSLAVILNCTVHLKNLCLDPD